MQAGQQTPGVIETCVLIVWINLIVRDVMIT